MAAVSSVPPSPRVTGSADVFLGTGSTKMANAALQLVSHCSKAGSRVRAAHTEALCLCMHITAHISFCHASNYKVCYSSGPPAFLIVANLMDVRRMNPDGTEEQILVKEPRGTILALDFDPVHHRVKLLSSVLLHILFLFTA